MDQQDNDKITQSNDETDRPDNLKSDKMFIILNWIVANPIQSLTLLGVFSYLLFRVAFHIYYHHFGVTPEEVGMGYIDILTAQATGGLLLVLVCVAIALYMRLKLVRGKYALRQLQDMYAQDQNLMKNSRIEIINSGLNKRLRDSAQTATMALIGLPLFYHCDIGCHQSW